MQGSERMVWLVAVGSRLKMFVRSWALGNFCGAWNDEGLSTNGVACKGHQGIYFEKKDLGLRLRGLGFKV